MKNKETGELTLKYIRESELNDPKHFTDYNTKAELELIESTNLVEWLTENYNAHGASL